MSEFNANILRHITYTGILITVDTHYCGSPAEVFDFGFFELSNRVPPTYLRNSFSTPAIETESVSSSAVKVSYAELHRF